MRIELKGTFTAIVTPFGPGGGAVDFESLKALLEFQLGAGVQGIVACGSTGEAATLSPSEYLEVVRYTVKHLQGRAPCIAGVSSSSTARACEIAPELKQIGVDALLVSGPPYNKPPQAGLLEHFRSIHKSCGLPIIAYNIPSRTGVNILPETIGVLAAEGTVCAVKEASGSMDQMLDLLRTLEGKTPVLSGEDSLVAPLMSCGGSGVISASANVAPAQFKEMTDAALSGNVVAAGHVQISLLPLIRALFCEPNPIPAKTALALLGVIRSPAVRLPLVDARAETVQRLTQLLEGYSR